MIGALVGWSLRNRVVVAALVVLLTVVGVRSWMALPVDAVPDVTNIQVQILTNAPGLAPLEVEQLVTRPVELSMTGIPGVQMIRSISRSSVSAVTVVFHDDVLLADARTLVSQRLPSARDAIPAAAGRPELGPLTTGLGEIYHFTVRWPGHTAAEIRTMFDWEIAYPMRSVPGVVEVNGWGGDTRQIEVRLRLPDMQALGVTQAEVEETLLGAGNNAGAGALERGGEQVLVRLDGQYRTAEDVAGQVIATRPSGVPVRVRDVATVKDGVAFRVAAATADGTGETVYGMIQLVAGGNAHEATERIRTRLDEVKRRLPAGIAVEPFYDRAHLVDRVLSTVKRSLLEGGLIVIVVLLVFLGDVAAGLVVATAIPLSMLGAFALMGMLGMSGNLMSLGAIDFGLVVDGAVVVVEGALAAMAAHKLSAREALAKEAIAFGGPIAFGVFIIAVVYTPVLLLEGYEGKMFRPMAWTVLFALGTALVLAFTWIPVLASLVVRKAHEGDVLVMRLIRRAYAPVLELFLRRPALSALLALLLVLAGVLAGMGRGAEFVPRLEEGDLAIQLTRPPSVSLTEAVEGTSAIERALRKFPEVRRVVSRTGSPDVATDIMGIEQSDVFVILKPRAEWTTADNREALVGIFSTELHKALPGTAIGFTQPIEMRFNELLGGMKSDVGVKVHGDDLGELTRIAREVQRMLSTIPGAADVRAEPTAGLAVATIRPNTAKMGRLGVRTEEVLAAIEALRAGRMVGKLVEGERRFDVAVRVDAPPAPNEEALAALPLAVSGAGVIRVGDVADVSVGEGPAQISRERARRRVLVECNVRGRDLATFVGELNRRLAGIPLPTGYHFSVSGQYENLTHAAARLAIIVPATLVGIFFLLYLSFKDFLPAVIIFLNVPVAASGGVLALAGRGLPMSISAAVGFIALFGVATLNGVVLLTSLRRWEAEGLDPVEAARRAAHDRLRPVLTTAVVASLGFVPMALATGTGAEVQRPLATVVIGGLVTATVLTLALLPSIYALARRKTAR
ncbi:MAG: efflux RND transporter permease subunit [Deltaproteobacteria bacterium]|nr:efflux RND transporter permease subunit [Deltaproteobacteria bacterium]